MSSVLDIDALAESPLADLHALASELGVEDYRLRRKPDLTVAILVARGADEGEVRTAVEAKFAALEAVAAERAAAEEAELERQEQERRAQAEERRERQAAPREGGGAGQRARGERGGRGGERGARGGEVGARGGGGRGGERAARGGGDQRRQQRERGERTERDQRRDRPEKDGGVESAERGAATFEVSGVFEPRQGGGGMLRAELGARSPKDVEVGRSEARKFRLYRGDVVVGTAKKSRRAKGAGLLAGVATVNGHAAEELKGERVRFDDAQTAPPSAQLAKRLFKAAPFGRGSRTLLVGPARGAASELLARLAEQLAGESVHATLAVVAAPPDGARASAGQGYEMVTGTLAERSKEFTTGLDLAVERGKRIAESGGDAVVIVDGIDLLPTPEARKIFGAARNLAEHGSLTVVGSAAPGGELEALASTTAVIADGRKLKLDRKKSWSSFK